MKLTISEPLRLALILCSTAVAFIISTDVGVAFFVGAIAGSFKRI